MLPAGSVVVAVCSLLRSHNAYELAIDCERPFAVFITVRYVVKHCHTYALRSRGDRVRPKPAACLPSAAAHGNKLASFSRPAFGCGNAPRVQLRS